MSALATLRRQVAQLQSRQSVDFDEPVLTWAQRVSGLQLDPWQMDVLRNPHPRQLLLCSRQVGKTEVSALVAARAALFSKAEVLVISPSFRQSANLYDRAAAYVQRTGSAIAHETRNRIALAHGGTLTALPGDRPDKVRGLVADVVVVDEAAFVRHDVLSVVMPMLSTRSGRLLMLSTPSGPVGSFYELWEHGGPSWSRTRALAADCPRISPEFLREARETLGDVMYRQEYLTEFVQAATAFFSAEAISAAFGSEAGVDYAEPVYNIYRKHA